MSCSWENFCKIKNECPSPYCQFSDEENADKIFDLIDEYVELKEKNMARTYTVTEYTKEDLEALDDMPLVDVVQALSEIKRGWMPQGYYGISNDEFKTYKVLRE